MFEEVPGKGCAEWICQPVVTVRLLLHVFVYLHAFNFPQGRGS